LLCQLLREPQGFPAHELSLLCPCTCAAKAWPAHPRSFLQDRRAWSHLRCAASALLPHQWPPACTRVVGCLAYACACGNKPSWPPVEHSLSHPRTCQSKSTRTSGSCNSAALSTCYDTIKAGLPPLPVLRCASNPCRAVSASTASCCCIAFPSELAPPQA
jgi:hypothetical protein